MEIRAVHVCTLYSVLVVCVFARKRTNHAVDEELGPDSSRQVVGRAEHWELSYEQR